MEEMQPLVGRRVGHPTELSVQCLPGVLWHRGQEEEALVGHRGSGRGVSRTVAPARTGLSLKGVLLPIGHNRVLERGSQPHACVVCSAGQRPYTPSTRGDLLRAGHRPLLPWRSCPREKVHYKP
jgi:hypothetical protein